MSNDECDSKSLALTATTKLGENMKLSFSRTYAKGCRVPVANVVGQHLASLQLLRIHIYVVNIRLYMTIICKTERTNYFGSELRLVKSFSL